MRIATGSVALDVECNNADANVQERCLTKAESVILETHQEPASLAASAACADNSKRFQSWRIENFTRQYDQLENTAEMVGSISRAADSGPTFTLQNMANDDIFSCTSGPEGVEGTCTLSSRSTTTTTTKFRFDAILGMLTITQNWACGDGMYVVEHIGSTSDSCIVLTACQ